ncbi:MAG: T9SS type A sorting domain-containing protein [Bacteroidetes bacterium]|nr:T9SS type A sorting domain-containing protein [Bacteroidota bacterium]
MNGSRQTYDQMMGLLRQANPAASLNRQEVEAVIASAGAEPAPRLRGASGRRVVWWSTGAILLLATGITAAWMLLSPTPSGRETMAPATVSEPQAIGLARTDVASIPPSPAIASPVVEAASRSDVNAIGYDAPPEPAASSVRRAAHPASHAGTPVSPAARHAGKPLQVDASAAKPSSHAPSQSLDTAPLASALAVQRPTVDRTMPVPPRPMPAEIPLLELTPAELRSLGITFANGGIETFCEESYTLDNPAQIKTFAEMGLDTTKRSGIVRMHLTIDTFSLTVRKYPFVQVDHFSHVAPIVVLNTYCKDARSTMSTFNSFDQSPIMAEAKRPLAPMVQALTSALARDDAWSLLHDTARANPIRMLVPVHLRLGDEPIDGSTRRRGADIILWYYPTQEFVAALPDRYRVPLAGELAAIADVVECHLPQSAACERMTGAPSLLNFCGRSSGALLGLEASPNPAHGPISLRYTLASERNIRITLHTLRGEYLRDLVPAAPAEKGTHRASIRTEGLESGVYMIVMHSNQGEQVSERLIIQ